MRIISASIDVSKIDKSKLIEGKNGAKYYNFDIVVNDAPDKFGKDVSLSAGQTKEERASKAKKLFIGNGKTVFAKEAAKSDAPISNNTQTNSQSDSTDLPF
jgi:hypothetical protein